VTKFCITNFDFKNFYKYKLIAYIYKKEVKGDFIEVTIQLKIEVFYTEENLSQNSVTIYITNTSNDKHIKTFI